MIGNLIACDVHRIEAAEPYSDDYDDTVARNVREQNADARPAIANPLPAIDQYDTVLLGSGIWNVRAPMIMSTFAESYDFTGKTVHPFTTYAMSGLGTTERDYARRAPAPPSPKGSPYAARRSTTPVLPSKPGCAAPGSSRTVHTLQGNLPAVNPNPLLTSPEGLHHERFQKMEHPGPATHR